LVRFGECQGMVLCLLCRPLRGIGGRYTIFDAN
jgi:hypothetical protein